MEVDTDTKRNPKTAVAMAVLGVVMVCVFGTVASVRVEVKEGKIVSGTE